MRTEASAAILCRISLLLIFIALTGLAIAQDLAPRAYVITPIHSNAVVITYSFFDGDLVFDNSVPVTGATAKANVSVFSYFHSLAFFGRNASITASLPY